MEPPPSGAAAAHAVSMVGDDVRDLAWNFDTFSEEAKQNDAKQMTLLEGILAEVRNKTNARGAGAAAGPESGAALLDADRVAIDRPPVVLGRGSHGVVKKGSLACAAKRVPVAVKIVSFDDPAAAAALSKELDILAGLKHKRLVHLYGFVRR